MNKKISLIVFISIFLLAAAVFQYNGKPGNVNASDNPLVEIDSPLDLESENTGNVENEMSIIEDTVKEKDVLPVINNKEKELEENASIKQDNYPDKITIDNDVFVKIMDDEKFADIINIARKYGAALYAIPYSDIFVIIKDEEPIFHMSAGIKGALPEYASLLKEAFANNDYADYTGLLDNIDHVVKTGESVEVELDEYMGYSIFESDGWIIVSY